MSYPLHITLEKADADILLKNRGFYMLDNPSLKSCIRDNLHHEKVYKFLEQEIHEGSVLSIVSAYFTIYAYEKMQSSLHEIDGLRFLFGDPDFVKRLDPKNTDPKTFDITDEGLQLNQQLRQKPVAQACAKWIKDKVEIRSTRESKLIHGKMYHINKDGVDKAILGSSNFTVRGLGLSSNNTNNIELNLEVNSEHELTDLKAWFDKLWDDDELVEDVKDKVLAKLKQIGQDHPPELIYYKSLYEYFRKEIETRKTSEQNLEDIHLYDMEIWKKLYDFQKDGAKSVIARLLQHNGCILADSVGLGKTYTALAVIKFFELRNERVLVLCPKKLRENWALYPAYNAQDSNEFLDDKFAYTLLSHTDLSRYTGESGSVNLENLNWGSFDLIVIDESHNFRNDSKPRKDEDGNLRHTRYSRLLEEVIKDGTKTKVLMLSATPVNTSLTDLRNQIYLMTEKREDAFRNTLGVSNIRNLIRQAQKAFKAWEESSTRSKTELFRTLGAEFFQLLGGVSIARSRKLITKYYADELEKIGNFPAHQAPINRHPPTDLSGELSYKALADLIGDFELTIYRPSSYVVSETAKRRLAAEKEKLHFNQEDRERFLIGMMRTNFLKRLESSAHSLLETLDRTINKHDVMLEKIELFEKNKDIPDAAADVLPDEDEEDEEFLINRAKNPYHLKELDCLRWKQDIIKDKQTLTDVRDKVKSITPEIDGKLERIKADIRDKVLNPKKDKKDNPNRKLLIFTTFKDTAEYLYENLAELASELNITRAMVSGDRTQTDCGQNNFNAILTNFAPWGRIRQEITENNIDLLIATDCVSEGQNLQDCDTVINYDIHWNPVRIIQRFGRIDRIGSQNIKIQMINYWPTKDMEVYLRLRNRVESRMALADATASGDDDPLNEWTYEQAQMELNFRDKQLEQLREEVIDLDDLSDGVVMSDFTLDYFFTQLLKYLERNRAKLEATPKGAYAVTKYEANPTEKGVIFFLHLKNPSENKQEKNASPIHPYYTVYIRDNGDIRYGCANAKQVLDLFEASAVGKDDVIDSLCLKFDQNTENGQNMTHYNKLLDTVITHITRSHTTTQVQSIKRGAPRGSRLTPASKTPKDSGDFELVTWLVIA